jgi:hypothetical protein
MRTKFRVCHCDRVAFFLQLLIDSCVLKSTLWTFLCPPSAKKSTFRRTREPLLFSLEVNPIRSFSNTLKLLMQTFDFQIGFIFKLINTKYLCACIAYVSITVNNTWNNWLVKRKGFFGFTVLNVPAHDWMAPLLLAFDEANYHGRNAW